MWDQPVKRRPTGQWGQPVSTRAWPIMGFHGLKGLGLARSTSGVVTFF
jgi:hypothetical protein